MQRHLSFMHTAIKLSVLQARYFLHPFMYAIAILNHIKGLKYLFCSFNAFNGGDPTEIE